MLNEKQNRQKKMRILKSKIFGGKHIKIYVHKTYKEEKKKSLKI